MAQSKYVLLHTLSQEKVDAAAERMRLAQERQVSAKQKLAQLISFQLEYQQRFKDKGMQGMEVTLWQDFQRFLQRLQDAVDIQQGEVDRCTQRFLLERQAWFSERRKLKAYEQLLTREQKRLARAEQRREQKITDEFASRRFWDQNHADE